MKKIIPSDATSLLAALLFSALVCFASSAEAGLLNVPTTRDYLLVGRGDSGTAVGVQIGSSNTLGRMFNVPSGSNPDVNDNPPWPLPSNGTPPQGNVTTNDGNVAVTNSGGVYNFQDIDVYADIGISCENDATGRCRDGWSNSTLSGGGSFNDDPNGMAAIESELDAAHSTISGYTATGGWSVSGDGIKNGANEWDITGGLVDTNTTITLGPGENVIIIDTNGNDFSLNNAGLVIGGPAGSSVTFLLKDQSQNFLFTNASVTLSNDPNSELGDNAVLFAMLDGGNGTNFNFSKFIGNGVAYWDLSEDGGSIVMNNVQACGQWVGDHLNFNDVQLTRCAHGVPEPASMALLASTSLFLVCRRRT